MPNSGEITLNRTEPFSERFDPTTDADVGLPALKSSLRSLSRITGNLVCVGQMEDVVPDRSWNGVVLDPAQIGERVEDEGLTADEWKISERRIGESFVPLGLAKMLGRTSVPQIRGCMDPRRRHGYDPNSLDWFISPLGPKTPGGSAVDAAIMTFASRATGHRDDEMSYTEAQQEIAIIDRSYGYEPGGHRLSQCGAVKFWIPAIHYVANQASAASNAARALAGPWGYEFSHDRQKSILSTAQELDNAPGVIIPDPDTMSLMLAHHNPDGQPVLDGEHKELAYVINNKRGTTLHTDEVSIRTKRKEGRQIEPFAHDIYYYHDIANRLGPRVGAFFLQAAANTLPPTAGNITDKNLMIYKYE